MMAKTRSFTGTIGTAAARGLPDEADVVVVGSGASGMAAALSAAVEGAKVLLLESERLVGGTSAISGGAIWVPDHGFSKRALKANDSLEEGRVYLLGQGRDETLDHEAVDLFLEEAPKIARFIEEHTYLSWIPVAWPDYTSDIRGASNFRSLFPGPFSPSVLGPAAKLVQPPKKSGMARNPLPLWLLNNIKGVWLAGYAMIGAYLEGCLTRGVDVRTEARATRLIKDDTGIVGVVVGEGDTAKTVKVRKGVVLASGGFEGNEELTSRFLGTPFPIQVSLRGHQGDAIGMVEEIGGDLVATDHAWWMPGIQLAGDQLEGVAISRLVQGERALPHTIMVNSKGERFANEAASYNDLGAVMREADPETGELPNATAWMIFDEYYHSRYAFLGAAPGGQYPPEVVSAPTLAELARKCGIDEAGLLRTVKEFNPEARKGRDPWFGRGTTTFERFFGDHNPFLGRLSVNSWAPAFADWSRRTISKLAGPIVGLVMSRIAKADRPDAMRALLVAPLAMVMRPALKNPASGAIGPINKPPYFAVKLEASAIGTLGGPRTDAKGRVLDTEGAVIPGLYAAGNVGGALTRGFYGGAGGTIVLGVVFGHIAGRDATTRK